MAKTKDKPTTVSFKIIKARAEKRKGGPSALRKMLPEKPDFKKLAKISDDRILAEMTQRVFSAGFAWSVIEAKWAGFEQAFLKFNPPKLALQGDDYWDSLLKDTRIVRNGAKINSVRENAVFVQAVAKEHGSFGKFLAGWPSADEIGLLDLLAKRGSRLGGNTGQMFLRFVGWDGLSPRRMWWRACATPGSTSAKRSSPRATWQRCKRNSMPGRRKPVCPMSTCRGSARCRSARTISRARAWHAVCTSEQTCEPECRQAGLP
jgi:3-methyladenine DNA glycosylase Tag